MKHLWRPMAVLTLTFAIHPAFAQPAAPIPSTLAEMSGTWDVSSRVWMNPGKAASEQPAAVAKRTIQAGGGFIVEHMGPAASSDPTFTREATMNYNAAEKVYEYASIDSRAPQLMHYRSGATGPLSPTTLRLEGGKFMVPAWGPWRNTRFAYRIELSPVTEGHQTLRIFFKPLAPVSGPEFLATQYDYVKRN